MKKPLAQDDQINDLIKALKEHKSSSCDNPIHVHRLPRSERLKAFMEYYEGNQNSKIAEWDVLKMLNQDKDENVN